MRYLTVFYRVEHLADQDPYENIDVDCQQFTKYSDRTIIVNGAVIHLPGIIVDVRSRVNNKGE